MLSIFSEPEKSLVSGLSGRENALFSTGSRLSGVKPSDFAKLSGVTLSGVTLSGVTLSGVTLPGSFFFELSFSPEIPEKVSKPNLRIFCLPSEVRELEISDLPEDSPSFLLWKFNCGTRRIPVYHFLKEQEF